ncbi:arsenate reductase [Amaricoccus solimangrovi]|uniref:Arsenate reductase n=1 Tax=Amaricoccus solimangrovi TaxID=2589815 RepID=A0A501X119_9RHOB|nr:arsenate reductase [Amaricoccus solimangrovi]TPE53016.1 arsenate reductase [Amaricoccus solimangrovi]
MITLHGIKTCDTVRKARGWLDARGIAYRFRDYKTEPPGAAELAAWSDRLGWEALLNRKGTTFRKLPEAEKADLDRAKAISLMIAHPSAIRRPLLESGETLRLGFEPEDYAALLAPGA